MNRLIHIDTYMPVSNLPDDFSKESTDLIKNILCYKWHIFYLGADGIYKLITAICADRYVEESELFDSPVGIPQSQDYEYPEINSILKNHCWDVFAEEIKFRNRFHSNFINTDIQQRENIILYLSKRFTEILPYKR